MLFRYNCRRVGSRARYAGSHHLDIPLKPISRVSPTQPTHDSSALDQATCCARRVRACHLRTRLQRRTPCMSPTYMTPALADQSGAILPCMRRDADEEVAAATHAGRLRDEDRAAGVRPGRRIGAGLGEFAAFPTSLYCAIEFAALLRCRSVSPRTRLMARQHHVARRLRPGRPRDQNKSRSPTPDRAALGAARATLPPPPARRSHHLHRRFGVALA